MATARLTLSDDLPTPPLPLLTAITRVNGFTIVGSAFSRARSRTFSINSVRWVPVMAVEDGEGIGGMPSAPMIGRAMGLVPSAIALFISVVRAHYNLVDFPCDLSRPQIELIAARVSAINQCFY